MAFWEYQEKQQFRIFFRKTQGSPRGVRLPALENPLPGPILKTSAPRGNNP